ncbi:hypothetical protein D3C72_1707580 [compost metagenome]
MVTSKATRLINGPWPTLSLPYQATPALTSGLCAAYIQVRRPPQQNPVTATRRGSPPLAAAHATLASRSAKTCSSGTLLTSSEMSFGMSV